MRLYAVAGGFLRVAVANKQDFDAVPCPRGYLGRRHPGIEPPRQAGVAEIVDPLGER
jgi:hypothetical protein